MKREIYLKKLQQLKLKHKGEINDIIKSHAMYNNPVKIGDIVTDHYHTIKVGSVGIYLDENKPSCIYYGALYTKAGKPSKKGVQDTLYQINLELINKKSIK